MCWCRPTGLSVSACDYVCMYFINNSTGQLMLCRAMDYPVSRPPMASLSRAEAHADFIRGGGGFHVELQEPTPTTPQTAAHHRCSAVFWLMHSSVLFLFVLMTIMSPLGNFDFLQMLLRQLLTPATFLPRRISRCQSWRLHTFSTRDSGKRAGKRAAIASEHVGMSCPLLERLLFIIMASTGKIQFPAQACVC